jgi:glycosyltransferase involved in cell wall biosynthesis
MQKSIDSDVFISIVVPAFNEQECIFAFYERAFPVLCDISNRFEIIFVDDGSLDNTAEKVRELHSKDPRVKLIALSRNFGKEIAMTAGLDFANGEIVVIIDVDLQDPPELIPKMVEKWKEGYDNVYATRVAREGESYIKKLTARAFYRVMRRLSRVDLPENTGDFRLLSRRAVEALKLLREQHRFMKGLFAWVGFRRAGILYRRERRFAGRTKWNYWRLWNFAMEGITSFTYIPLQFSVYLGCIIALFSFGYSVFLVLRTLLFGRDLPGYASIMVAILFLGAVQLIFLGVIGEYLGRMYNETKQRPLYLVQGLEGIEHPLNKADTHPGCK